MKGQIRQKQNSVSKKALTYWLFGLLIAALIGFSYCILGNFLVKLTGIPDISLFGNDPVTLMEEDSLALLIILEVLIVPVVEELLFRKLFYGKLRKKMHFVWAALIVSAAFAVLHLNLAQAAYAFVFSLILCEIAERTANWYFCVGAHIAANLGALLASRILAFNTLLLLSPAATVVVSALLLVGGLLLLIRFENS
ncbi:MAG: CPBP family intramembrane metalloprotease [Lachnospiraceae bacterium]|nr:CPBP family intramembrane metalloprotease [Lachnospiraceae bacterium]